MITAPWKAAKTRHCLSTHRLLRVPRYRLYGSHGVYELMLFNEVIKEQISHNISLDDLRTIAYKEGMHPLRLSGAQKVASGYTRSTKSYA